MLEKAEFLSIMALAFCAVSVAAAIVGGIYLKCRKGGCICGGEKH
jgi:hypothetical protein